MSLIAGAYNRSRDRPLQQSIFTSLKRLISRHPSDDIDVFQDSKCVLMKVDIGAYGEKAFHIDSSGSVSMLAGEALLYTSEVLSTPSRSHDLEKLHASWSRGDYSLLGHTRGTFAAIYYQPVPSQLRLVADKLSVRPMYLYVDDNIVIFASALRVLEELPEVPKRMDLRAVTEISCLGYPLGDRTPYCNIFRLRPSEIIEISDSTITRSCYWKWGEIQRSDLPEEKLLEDAHVCFKGSVEIRRRHDSTAFAYLSGGLDSRCIVAALRSQNMGVHTFNFSWEGTPDRVLGFEFARRIGSFHHEEPPGDITLECRLPKRLAELQATKVSTWDPVPERPNLVWSGDGGSVGLGHVYLSRRLANLLGSNLLDEAITQFIQDQHLLVLSKLLKRGIAVQLANVIREGIRRELEIIRCPDPMRRFYLFLLFNDQRRHLDIFYENLDQHRIEYQLPFFDSSFLESIVRIPLELCLDHRFYNKWLSHFPSAVHEVPWQSYPGHEPCPLPLPKELIAGQQWGNEASKGTSGAHYTKLIESAKDILKTPGLSSILNMPYLRLAVWACRLGWHDYAYIIGAARIYSRYWSRSAGKYALIKMD
jgi:asparagine synthase (glutamine-hydrolysing)